MKKMNKYIDMAMYRGRLMIYKDNKVCEYMPDAFFVYNEDENYFLLYDNEIISYFENILDNKENAFVGFEESYNRHKYSITPKKEEGYVFIDEASLVNLDEKKGKKKK